MKKKNVGAKWKRGQNIKTKKYFNQNKNYSKANIGDVVLFNTDIPIFENPYTKVWQIEINEIDINLLECDPRVNKKIWDYHVNQHDNIYIKIILCLFIILYFFNTK